MNATEPRAADEATPVRVQRITPAGGLFDLGLREMWEYRQLLYFFVWRDVKVRYKQTLIGSSWAILQPLATMVLFTVFFGNVLRVSTGGIPDPIFYYCSLLPWIYFSLAVTNASNSVVGNQNLIHKIYFPRLMLPFSAVVPGLLDLAIAFVVLLVMMPIFDVGFGASLLLAPFLVALGSLAALAIGVWLSILNARYRDVRFLVPFLVQMLFFASPIVYPADEIPERWQSLYNLNPLVGVIEGFRWSVTGQGDPPGWSTLVSLCVIVVLLAAGLVFFRKEEATIADIV